jgi:hypothetical protein
MAEALIMEFTGIGELEYDAVNKILNMDPQTGEGDWPPGLLSHAAGTSDDGAFIVTEIWSSRADQEAFLMSRLAAALEPGGVTVPPMARWVSLVSYSEPLT